MYGWYLMGQHNKSADTLVSGTQILQSRLPWFPIPKQKNSTYIDIEKSLSMQNFTTCKVYFNKFGFKIKRKYDAFYYITVIRVVDLPSLSP